VYSALNSWVHPPLPTRDLVSTPLRQAHVLRDVVEGEACLARLENGLVAGATCLVRIGLGSRVSSSGFDEPTYSGETIVLSAHLPIMAGQRQVVNIPIRTFAGSSGVPEIRGPPEPRLYGSKSSTADLFMGSHACGQRMVTSGLAWFSRS
jgi:hypothetical protein